MRRKDKVILGIFLMLLGLSWASSGWARGELLPFGLGIALTIGGAIFLAISIAKKPQRTSSAECPATPSPTELLREQRAKARLSRKHIPFPDELNGMVKKYSYDSVRIYAPDDVDLTAFELGDTLYVAKEPTNPHDDRAVILSHCPTGEKLGYLYRGKLQEMANDFLSRLGDFVIGRVYDIDDLSRSVWIDLAFYRDETELDEEYDEEDE